MMTELKMWLAVRTDLTMSPQKMAVQSGHAFQMLLMNALNHDPVRVSDYLAHAMPKIVVRADDEAHLVKIEETAKEHRIPTALVTDAGRTEFDGPTMTVCAFGPCLRDELPPLLKRLRLF